MMPESIKIGVNEWKIILDPTLAKRGCEGECDPEKHEIRIDPNLCEDRQWDSLYHELDHAIADMAGLGNHEAEEEFVTRMSPIRRMVFKENRDRLLG